MLEAVAEKVEWTSAVRMLRKDDSIGWIEPMCTTIMDDNNEMIGALGINRDISQRVYEKQLLRYHALFDHLTNIPNRYFLIDHMDHLINQYDRNKNAFSLLFFDLDKFKQINDTHGHTFGDLTLKRVAARISKCTRKTDMVARLEGDEFVLLFENTYKKKDIEATIKHLTSDLARDMNLEDKTLNINCVIGFAIFPNDVSTSDKLFVHADADMYSSKQRQGH